MNMKASITRNIALMVVFVAVGLTMFTQNVRTVQIIGLMSCGAVFGSALTAVISAFKSKQTKP
jgi:energy-converting hydrogenase Eha subunit A